jgi:hypothetical protein
MSFLLWFFGTLIECKSQVNVERRRNLVLCLVHTSRCPDAILLTVKSNKHAQRSRARSKILASDRLGHEPDGLHVQLAMVDVASLRGWLGWHFGTNSAPC